MAPRSSITTVSLRPDLLRRLDDAARQHRRSRSFIVAEAVEAWLERESRRGFDEARERTLREGLALSPAARVSLAESLWGELARGLGPGAPWTASFDSFDEYERWRRAGRHAG
jgi:predicted transcriptional regulator